MLAANIGGFWDPLYALLDHMRTLKFIRSEFSVNLLMADKIADILPMLEAAAEAVPEKAREMTTADPDKL